MLCDTAKPCETQGNVLLSEYIIEAGNILLTIEEIKMMEQQTANGSTV
jgi:hypothetical protein